MLFDEASQLRQFVTAKPLVGGETDWGQPELRVPLGLFDVDVRRLVALIAEKEKAEPLHPEDGRHTLK
jgi:hypothetical protein